MADCAIRLRGGSRRPHLCARPVAGRFARQGSALPRDHLRMFRRRLRILINLASIAVRMGRAIYGPGDNGRSSRHTCRSVPQHAYAPSPACRNERCRSSHPDASACFGRNRHIQFRGQSPTARRRASAQSCGAGEHETLRVIRIDTETSDGDAPPLTQLGELGRPAARTGPGNGR